MASFAGEFGLQPLLGRPLAIIDDLRLGTHSDKSLITERLLSITGEGELSVSRKYLPPWQGQIRTKFLIVSNEVPAFADDSGAIASRFVSLTTRRSFYGAENLDLAKNLKTEWPGILLWALAGLRRLYERRRFQSQRDEEMRGRLAAAASPVVAFIEARCVLDRGGRVEKDAIFSRFCGWTQDNKMPVMDKQHFGEALLAAAKGLITSTKPVVGGTQRPHYKGIRPRTDADDRVRDAATLF